VAKKVLVLVHQIANRPAHYLDRLRQAGFEVVHSGLSWLPSEAELIERLPGAFATIAGGEPYTERVFESAKALRIVARFGVGWDQVDVPAATRHGVTVAMAFGANHESVADGAFTLLAACACNLPAKHMLVAGGGWGCGFHKGIWRQTLGIIGLGRIGRALARRCKHGFDMRVLAYDPMPDRAYAAAEGIELVPLDELLARADFVSLHIPFTRENEGFINAGRLARMKSTAFLINTARGALIDESALYDALAGRRIAGAGLDVYRREPPVGSPLLGLDNVVLLPHSSGMDETAEVAMANRCIDAILACARGEHPGIEYVINPSVLSIPAATSRSKES
jgi:D-3-phosphoglycerate dehydrogenase / 2-oxoglutarate reductase